MDKDDKDDRNMLNIPHFVSERFPRGGFAQFMENIYRQVFETTRLVNDSALNHGKSSIPKCIPKWYTSFHGGGLLGFQTMSKLLDTWPWHQNGKKIQLNPKGGPQNPNKKPKKNIESEQLQNNSGNPKKTVELQDPNILLHDNETYNWPNRPPRLSLLDGTTWWASRRHYFPDDVGFGPPEVAVLNGENHGDMK